MSVNIESFGIDRLTVPERLALIEQIWDSLPTSLDPQDLPNGHLAELALRRAEMEAHPGKGRPWRDVLDPLESDS